jgi:hypothetical protein
MFDAAAVDKARQAIELDQRPHDSRDTELLYRIYMEKRVQSQIKFYESRVRENQLNADFTFGLGTLVMTLSSLVATISASVNLPFLSLLAAVFPAFAALLGSFRQLYGWERQSNIYRDALMGLERVKLISPDDDRIAAADLTQIYPRLIVGGETVFTGEVNQWGQFVQSTELEAAAETADSKAYNSLVDDLQGRTEKLGGLSDEQINTIKSILAGGKATAFGRSELLDQEDAIADIVPAEPDTPPPAKTWPPTLPDMDLPAADTAVIEMSNNNHHDDAPPAEQEDSLAPGALHVETVEAAKDDGLFG